MGLLVRAPIGRRDIPAGIFAGLPLTGRAVLVETGWDQHWRTDAYFEGHPFLTANDTDESIFEAAELLSDGEFVEFMKGYHEKRSKAEKAPDVYTKMEGACVVVLLHEDLSDENNLDYQEVDLGPFDLSEALGRWAVRLRQSGLLYEKAEQTTVYEQLRETRSGKKSPISMGVATSVHFRPACARLCALIEQALPANPQAH